MYLRMLPCVLSVQTTGFTGADLANLVNEAALLAGRGNKGAHGGWLRRMAMACVCVTGCAWLDWLGCPLLV